MACAYSTRINAGLLILNENIDWLCHRRRRRRRRWARRQGTTDESPPDAETAAREVQARSVSRSPLLEVQDFRLDCFPVSARRHKNAEYRI